MSNGPTLPNFSTPEGVLYLPELDVALMAIVDEQAAREAADKVQIREPLPKE